jgi:DNA (cytosine-5)-methyltransferase 1
MARNRQIAAGKFYEFFAGGGMARAGLGSSWTCLLSNDIDEKKGAAYQQNWGSKELKIEDVGRLSTHNLPGTADLAWASFPCQDLSLAGNGAGLRGARSGTFWPFWRLMKDLAQQGRAPALIVLENVCGAITSHDGKDFAALTSALADESYNFGALVIDAVHFVPQSRPRLFIVAVKDDIAIPSGLVRKTADPLWATATLVQAQKDLDKELRDRWVWWNLPAPAARTVAFSNLIEDEPEGVSWHTKAETKKLLDMMSPLNRKKVLSARKAGKRMIGTIYKRTRPDQTGRRVQRAEIRFDDIAGCLRTPVGGSSRQVLMFVEGDQVQSRLLSPREAARLMGLSDSYKLPKNYNEAYHLAGDGLVVPAVRHLAKHILEPALVAVRTEAKATAA